MAVLSGISRRDTWAVEWPVLSRGQAMGTGFIFKNKRDAYQTLTGI